MRDWDRVFRSILQLPEERKIEIAKLLKQQVKQAKRHPKYFSAQVYAILQFIEGYREVMPKEIIEVMNQVYNMISEKESFMRLAGIVKLSTLTKSKRVHETFEKELKKDVEEAFK